MTEHEVQIARKAFVRGAEWGRVIPAISPTIESRKQYPDPPRPREVRLFDGNLFRCVNGVLQIKTNGEWLDAMFATAETVRALYDLLEHPTE